ncbi:hypothetical protein BGZ80_009736 [Entomortierella chlamydospora]|uniref:CUE domain-containing protein n=1 Tax=Entomortierella chlamydospora TaxID=101097 RepID=A0A9P6N4I1_9FUNG|nr:hypothetical protein BGZ79_007620 [Entomortierella chlamydospora]KAG0023333.1 hypothetical protein BGZ80_009736 [Entomortierella chlamydospora]
MAIVTDLLPFVTPLTDQTLTETDFSIAVDDWNESLSKILRHNTKAFWKELLQNVSLSRFLNLFLGEYASFRGNKDDIWIMELGEVIRRVFMIYHRISVTMTEPDAIAISNELLADQGLSDPGSALLDQGLVSTSVLMDFAGIYGSSDPEGVSRIVGTILQNTPSLIGDFRASTNTVVQIIRRVQKRFEKGVSGGAGKGKGKGKGVSPSMSPEPNAPELDQGKLNEVMQYTSALSNIAYALDAVSAVSPLLATELLQHPTFLQCLTGCYNYTLPILTKVLIDNQAVGGINARPVLSFLRLKMLSIVNNVLDGIYKQHRSNLDTDSQSSTGPSLSEGEDEAAALTDRLCEVIVNLYEQSPLQEHMVPMVDAPMILDLELQFCISERLSDINSKMFNGENDRLNHWVVMLTNLQQFNPATQDFIYEHNMRKSEKMAREMSTIYIGLEQDRSSTTTISDNSAPRVLVAPMSVDQEEDYVKRTMLISQLQDLFPDLGDGFLEACLIAFKDNPEVVTMRLLEEDLPSDLATMDRSTARSMPHRVESAPTSMALVEVPGFKDPQEQDVLSNRRNIFDGDEFDVFSGNIVDKSKVSRGGKKGPKDAAVVLDDKSFVSEHKSAILQAVDSMYDDEYDDTYDSMGVNSAGADFRLVDDIDANTDEGVTKQANGRAQMQIDPSIEHEEALINMYTGQKEVFNRSAEARRSKKRQELRNLTKMSDEQLEGWAIMFGRNPRRAEITQKYEFRGEQTEVERSEPIDKRRGGRMPFVEKNATQSRPNQQQQQPQQQQGSRPQQGQKKSQQSSRTSTPDTSSPKQGQEQQSKTSPAGNDKRDRAKSERQKSAKANHNRRNQHAKKMAVVNP